MSAARALLALVSLSWGSAAAAAGQQLRFRVRNLPVPRELEE